MAKPVNWTARLPIAPLRSAAEVTRPIRTMLRRGDPGEASAPASPPHTEATVTDFTRRAVREVERLDMNAVEIRPERAAAERLLPPERFDTLAARPLHPFPMRPAVRPGRLAADLAAADACYGIAVCVGVLERYPEPLSLMTELGRILQPGGLLYLVAPLTVPEPNQPATLPFDSERRRYGLNYLLDAASLQLEHLQAVASQANDITSPYAVIARRSARPG